MFLLGFIERLRSEKIIDLFLSSRLETKLQVQDLNIILRFFGKSKRWQDVSQVRNLDNFFSAYLLNIL